MNSQMYLDRTVGELVAEKPARSRVFESFGIDYCCGGKLPLAQACRNAGVEAEQVVAGIDTADSAPAAGPDPQTLTMTELCDHIVATHHDYLRRELPRLATMAAKVARVHAEHHPWGIQLAEIYAGLDSELTLHMMKEEQILFPAIRSMESGAGGCNGMCGFIGGPIGVMEAEHESAGVALARMRELSGGYTAPDDACNTFRALLDGLTELEADLHLHIHKENNILFPRALAAAEK